MFNEGESFRDTRLMNMENPRISFARPFHPPLGAGIFNRWSLFSRLGRPLFCAAVLFIIFRDGGGGREVDTEYGLFCVEQKGRDRG